ncbi:hypothetical protein MNBD_GAMMA21-3038 [hydrothermal vent metagenome]|uniref:Co-chaperone DjlA N-terminal domain-containing protein n=1 Tax=hydrothermal vent metagenome TaxID=652676 RepID=A0A3B0ZWN8_9ZZZZ
MNEQDREEVLKLLENNFGVTGNQVYLLDLIPLAEMLWIDGKNQTEEINLVYEFAIKHIAELSTHTEGEELLSENEINDFMQRFVHTRPSKELLTTLRKLANSFIFQQHDQVQNELRKQRIIDFCIDIASAAVTQYPYDRHNRFIAEEKVLLSDLMQTLNINFDAEIN